MNPQSDRPSMPVSAPALRQAQGSDLDLLRRFEPVLYFTLGEQFFPMDVERYVSECSLWERQPDGSEQLLVRQGELTVEKLTACRPAPFGAVRFLRFIEPLDLAESASVLAGQARLRLRLHNAFHPGLGRLARGGFLPRLADGLFSLSFLLRGRVSAATAAAAELDYNDILRGDRRYVYYGRVVRAGGWTVLQYWYFYCFNSWRSGFHGVNDHESDWEQVSIYLYEQGGELVPEWAAYASHDFKGDDLRRRWDDDGELLKEDGHPVVHVGAGSHASYFRKGEYQAEVTLPLPGWVAGLTRLWNKFWTGTLGQPAANPFRIPFVDYARGDGLRVGPGELPGRKAAACGTWSPVPVDESVPWVGQYRGLWGLFARDPISGENAPAGPMYNRDGSPRSAWYDPLGFAGLDKVPPPPKAQALLEHNRRKIAARQKELEKLIPGKADELQSLGIRLKGMEGNPHLAKQYAALEKNIAALGAEVRGLRREGSENGALLEGLDRRLERARACEMEDPRLHIRHLAEPVQADQVFRFGHAAETWAAISLSLMLFAIAVLIFFAPNFIWAGLGIVFILFLVAESILRGAFVPTVARITLVLAMAAVVILFFHFWKWIIVGALLAMGISLMYQRLRELTG